MKKIIRYMIKPHRDHWNSMPQWAKTSWKVALTVSLAVQVSPLVYGWTH